MHYRTTVKINGEKASYMDAKSAVALYNSGGMAERDAVCSDENVRRATRYNEVVFANMVKRIIAYASGNTEHTDEQASALEQLCRRELSLNNRDKVMITDKLTPDHYGFLGPVLDPSVTVRGYTEYILFSVIQHYYHYTRN
ncbi:MAG: hypothetical protein HZC28_08045 [Spirochaetes bacterium]|nr:hypothetical protein [Spirochaetota bacterium]